MSKDTLTMEMILEAADRLKALTPPRSPDNVQFLNIGFGLRVMKNTMLPDDTIVVSQVLFDKIYNSGEVSD